MLPLRIIVFLLLICFCRNIYAQNIVVPSKRSLEDLTALPDDTMKVLYMYRVAWDTAYYDLALGIKYADAALEVAQRLNYTRGIILSLNALGATYNDMGEYDKALDAHIEGLKWCEQYGDYQRTGTCLMNLSLVYSSLGDTLNAQRRLKEAVDIWEENNYEKGLSHAYINLAAQELSLDMLDEAIGHLNKSLVLSRKLNLPTVEAHSLSSLALAHAEQGKYAEANDYLSAALSIIDTLGDDYMSAQVIYNAAVTYSVEKNYDEALKCYNKSLMIFKQIGVREEIVDLYHNLSQTYFFTSQPDSALQYYKSYMLLKDSLVNEDVIKHQRNLEARYESEKQQKEIELLTRKGNVRKWFLFAIGGCFVVLIFLVIMLYKRNQFRKQTNAETAEQNALIEEKNRNITDSINYASRIQEAVVPSVGQLQQNFSDAFVLSKPKDIVSGDFWWCTEKSGEFFLAGADSTGHGVPGGFMSMLGSVFLFEIINEKGTSDPAEILNQKREKIISALSRSGTAASVKDGMDMVMCRFSPDRKKIQFACAMNPLWVIRKNTVIEYRADKFPVGEYHGDTRSFTLLEHEGHAGDMVYIFSDGYADQFGGNDGKKFKYKQLRDLLCGISDLPCHEQKKSLEKKFEEWKGAHEQVDDVLLIGIRL